METAHKPTGSLDIAMIGAAPFHWHLAKKGLEAFITSLSEIDCVIQEKQEVGKAEPNEEEMVQQLLPEQYQEYADVFSKAASDKLPPRWTNDYKVTLEEGKTVESMVGYSLLYKQTAEELEAAQTYILDNLGKDS